MKLLPLMLGTSVFFILLFSVGGCKSVEVTAPLITPETAAVDKKLCGFWVTQLLIKNQNLKQFKSKTATTYDPFHPDALSYGGIVEFIHPANLPGTPRALMVSEATGYVPEQSKYSGVKLDNVKRYFLVQSITNRKGKVGQYLQDFDLKTGRVNAKSLWQYDINDKGMELIPLNDGIVERLVSQKTLPGTLISTPQGTPKTVDSVQSANVKIELDRKELLRYLQNPDAESLFAPMTNWFPDLSLRTTRLIAFDEVASAAVREMTKQEISSDSSARPNTAQAPGIPPAAIFSLLGLVFCSGAYLGNQLSRRRG